MENKITELINQSIKDGKDCMCNDNRFANEFASIISKFNLNIFIETGSYLGHSSDLIKSLFPKLEIYSCDINNSYVEIAKNGNDSINYEVKDSIPFLKEKIELLNEKLLFIFLDAHGFGGDFPLEEELLLIGNSTKQFILCIHDCKIPNYNNFGYDTYGGVSISTELIEKTLKKTNCSFNIYIPSEQYSHFNLRGRCYVLINPDKEMIRNMNDNKLLKGIL
jgi:hypothetical protein